MKAIKATYAQGQLTFSEAPPENGPVEVLVIFPEKSSDSWADILAEQTPRRRLSSSPVSAWSK